jgi:hypothetical protein
VEQLALDARVVRCDEGDVAGVVVLDDSSDGKPALGESGVAMSSADGWPERKGDAAESRIVCGAVNSASVAQCEDKAGGLCPSRAGEELPDDSDVTPGVGVERGENNKHHCYTSFGMYKAKAALRLERLSEAGGAFRPGNVESCGASRPGSNRAARRRGMDACDAST